MNWPVLLSFIITKLNIVVMQTAESELHSGFMDVNFLITKAAHMAESDISLVPNKELRLVVSSLFTCDGSISGFYLGARVHLSGSLYPQAEVWRTIEDGYIQRYSVELRPSFSDVLPSGMHKYLLPTSDPLFFRENDIFVIYQPCQSESAVSLYDTTMTQAFQSVSFITDDYSSFVYVESEKSGSSKLDAIFQQYPLIHPISEESNCLTGFLSDQKIQELSSQIGGLKQQPNSELRLFPDMKFNKKGYITKWIVACKTIDEDPHEITTELQIWRQNSINTSYTRVASYQLNEKNSVFVSENVREYFVIPPILIQAEDILGIFQPPSSSVNLYYQNYNGPSNIVIPVTDTTAPLVVGNQIPTTSNDYPLIAVNVSTREFIAEGMNNTNAIEDRLVDLQTEISSKITQTINPFPVTTNMPLLNKPSHSSVISTNKPEATSFFNSMIISQSQELPSPMTNHDTNHDTLLMIILSIVAIVILCILQAIVIIGLCVCCTCKQHVSFMHKNSSAIGPASLTVNSQTDNIQNIKQRESMEINPIYHHHAMSRQPPSVAEGPASEPAVSNINTQQLQEPQYDELLPCRYSMSPNSV